MNEQIEAALNGIYNEEASLTEYLLKYGTRPEDDLRSHVFALESELMLRERVITQLSADKVDSAERITKMEADNKRYKAELKFIRTGNDDDLKAALA